MQDYMAALDPVAAEDILALVHTFLNFVDPVAAEHILALVHALLNIVDLILGYSPVQDLQNIADLVDTDYQVIDEVLHLLSVSYF